MTPAEQAAEIVQWWREGTDNPDDWHAALAAKIAAAIEQARREEREFFVNIVSRPAVWDMLYRHETDAIRARAKEEKQK